MGLQPHLVSRVLNGIFSFAIRYLISQLALPEVATSYSTTVATCDSFCYNTNEVTLRTSITFVNYCEVDNQLAQICAINIEFHFYIYRSF